MMMRPSQSVTQLVSTAAKALVPSLALMTAHAAMASIPLHIYNSDSRQINVKISDEIFNCYEGDFPIGHSFNNVLPGQSVTIMLSRVQGHGCDGRQGEFELIFDPAYNNYRIQHFDFDNDGGLELSSGRANPYPGTLSRNPDGSYTYRTPRQQAVTASAPEAGWSLVCQAICARTVSYQVISTRTHETRTSEETRSAIEAALTSSLKFKGIGGIEGS